MGEKEIIRYELESKLLSVKNNQLHNEYLIKIQGEPSDVLIQRNIRLLRDIDKLIDTLKES